MKTKRLSFYLLVGCSVLLLGLAPLWGVTGYMAAETERSAFVIWKLRVPRALTAFLAGAGLSLAGTIFQALFRNPLATPFTLGVASGAAFGASLSMLFAAELLFVSSIGVAGGALAGALALVVLVYFVAARSQHRGTSALLLSGVVLSFFFSSLVLFVQYLSDAAQVFAMSRWLMGSVSVVGYEKILLLLPAEILLLLVAYRQAAALELIRHGDEFAASKGVDLERCRLVLYLSVSLMVAFIVACCGVIGFVGIIVPYLIQLGLKYQGRTLLFAAWFAGGAFLVCCDFVARMAIPPAEIPVGVVTALLGAPVFIWILLKPQRT